MFSSVTYYLQEKHIKDLVEVSKVLEMFCFVFLGEAAFTSRVYISLYCSLGIVLQLKRILLNGGAKKEFYLSSLVQYVICDDEDIAKKIEEDVKEANPEAVIVKVVSAISYTS